MIIVLKRPRKHQKVQRIYISLVAGNSLTLYNWKLDSIGVEGKDDLETIPTSKTTLLKTMNPIKSRAKTELNEKVEEGTEGLRNTIEKIQETKTNFKYLKNFIKLNN